MKWKYSDFEKEPELSPDLEWMIQSGQVSRQVFLETLVKTHYAPMYRLALSLLNDVTAARFAVREVFSRLVLSAHRYRSQMGMDAWIKQIAFQVIESGMRRERLWRGVERLAGAKGQFTNPMNVLPQTELDRYIWQQVDQLPEVERIPLVLYLANDWQPEQIAAVLKTTPAQVLERLERSLTRFMHLRQAQSPDLEAVVRASLQRRWSLPELQEDETRQFSLKVERHTARRSLLRGGMATTREIALLGFVLLALILAIWGGNRYLMQATSGAHSSDSDLDGFGLAFLENWFGASLFTVAERQTTEENNSASSLGQGFDPVMEARPRRGDLIPRYLQNSPEDLTKGRYTAFANKDRIRRFAIPVVVETPEPAACERRGEAH